VIRSLPLLAMLAVPMAVANAEEPRSAGGAALGVAALHAGSGEHPLAAVMGGWVRVGLGEACHLEPELTLGRRSEGGSLARVQGHWYRGALGVGCAAGTRATKVTASLGPAVTYHHTVIEADERYRASSLGLGLRFRAGFLIPVGERLELDLLAGGSTHGRVVDHDLLLQGGVRW
jgi:hypothetical protein